MKQRLYLSLTLIFVTIGIQARVFDEGERLYINMEAKSVKDAGGELQYGWYATTNNYNYAYFFNNSTSKNAWSGQVQQYIGTCWYVEAPAGDWEGVILTRHSSANASWSTKTHQTGDISFYYIEDGKTIMREQNYISNFYYGTNKEGADWEFVAPDPSGDPSVWSLPYEDEQICTDAAGTTYSLQAKNYDYLNTYAHAWFKYENNAWTRIQGDQWRKDEGAKAYDVTLGAAYSDVYYFLQCSRPTMCRLLRIRPNQNCAEGAEGACKITSFIAVASDANVTDATCSIDGIVAYDDKKNAGDLKIWCVGVDTITIQNSALETPQTFKLKGFDASSTKTYTLHAKFLSGTSVCEDECTVTVHPPTASIKTHTTTGTSTDLRLTRFTEEDITLTPDDQTSTYFQWTNSANDDKITGKYPENRNITFTAPTTQQDIEYVLLATNDPPSAEGNLIANGTFETTDHLESKYEYWGKDLTDYYTTHPGASGGYALVKNSSIFYHTYNTVTAHEGQYFGLFDSKITNNINEQAAWIARSSDNPKLKVQAGVSYLFSFWVANINTYSQMNNGARLQFQISYNGGSSWNNLGGEIDLGKYKDNRWHGLSSIATPNTSSDNVVLRVVNKNTSDVNIGNDFALDDIRFEAVTSHSSNIAGYERFPVKYLQCAIQSASFEQQQPVGCGSTKADVKYTINFIYPRGDLYIYEGTTKLAQISHTTIGDNATSYSGVIPDQLVDNADHELTVYFDDGHVKTDAPTTYTYNAKAVPAISVKSLTWGTVACDVPTVTLTAVINYTNQNGALTANVDGGSTASASYTIESDEEKEVTIIIPGVAADGLGGHLLNVNFDGSHGCAIKDHAIPEVAPVTPTIDTAHIAFSAPSCTDLTTTLTFDINYTYQQGKLQYWVDGLPAQTATYKEADPAVQTLTSLTVANIPADGKNDHVLHVSFDGANSCVKDYTLPAVPFSPVIDAVKIISAVPAMVTCATPYYTADVAVQLHYNPTGQGKNITLHYNNGIEGKDTTVAASAQNTTINGIKLYNMDETDPQTIYAEVAGYTPVCPDSVKYTAPKIARITPLFDVTVSETACDVLNYSLSGTISFDMPDGNLIVEYDATHRDVIAVPTGSTSANFSISGMTATGTGMGLKAWFENSNTPACTVDSKPFDAPVVPTIDTAHIAFSTPGCTNLTTTLTFDLNYTYQQGKLQYWVDDMTPKEETGLTTDTERQVTSLSFADIPADGKNTHKLHIKFDGANSCEKTYNLPYVPFSPVINSLTVIPEKNAVQCNEDEYKATVTIVTPYDATGKNFLLQYEGKDSTIAATATSMTIQIPLTLIGGNEETMSVAYTDAKECLTNATYSSPIRLDCYKDNDTICEGEDYTWERHQQTYQKPAVGEHTFTHGADSLILTVIAIPQITLKQVERTCDNEQELRIPFAITKGNPGRFTLDVNGNTYEGTIDGSDIVFHNTDLAAGDYTVTITVSDENSPCTSQQKVSFTIAISGQMYSKWTDVLFISNKEEEYISYQWYKDGELMEGETQQRLYNPEGLPGIYFCQMTTKDNKTLFTCPQRFEEATPSRSENTSQKVNATMIFDSMGRTVATTPNKGIYIIIEQLENGDIRSRKTAIYE